VIAPKIVSTTRPLLVNIGPSTSQLWIAIGFIRALQKYMALFTFQEIMIALILIYFSTVYAADNYLVLSAD
jgi:hypothetical protein